MRVLGIDPIQHWPTAAAPRGLDLRGAAAQRSGLRDRPRPAAMSSSVFLQGVNSWPLIINGLTVLTGLGEPRAGRDQGAVVRRGRRPGRVLPRPDRKGGPKGVGNAVNETVVYAFICLVRDQRDHDGNRRPGACPMSYDATRSASAGCPAAYLRGQRQRRRAGAVLRRDHAVSCRTPSTATARRPSGW